MKTLPQAVSQAALDTDSFSADKKPTEDEKRDNYRIQRSMTIVINEEGHPLWLKVDEIWEEFKLKENQTLTAAQAK